jgi:hypothetical protein
VRAASVILAGDPGITPNRTGLPGLNTAMDIVGAVLTYGLIACVAAVAISAAAWAFGHLQGNARYTDTGKTGTLTAALAALLIGGANLIVTFFSNVGGALH